MKMHAVTDNPALPETETVTSYRQYQLRCAARA